jgi:hypothetical protein
MTDISPETNDCARQLFFWVKSVIEITSYLTTGPASGGLKICEFSHVA